MFTHFKSYSSKRKIAFDVISKKSLKKSPKDWSFSDPAQVNSSPLMPDLIVYSNIAISKCQIV